MFTEYNLTLTVDRIIGGIPRHPEMVRRWQETRWPEGKKAEGIDLDDAVAQTVAELGSQAIEEGTAAVWTGFAEHEGQLVIEERQIKAMLKESANIIRTMVKVHGKVIPLRAKLAERVFVRPHWVSLGVAQPTGTIERPIHVMTMQGPRTALKRTDYVDDVKLVCTLRVLDDGIITRPVLEAILTHAAENGIGTDRSQGNGTFDWQLD